VTGSKWSARDILNSSIEIANALHNYGIGQNDVVGIVSENRVEFVIIAFGTFMLNAHLAPVNHNYIESK
jgi:acyl-CoA synthetase (AMP-forming)/AMP-acid ligase II